MDLINDPQWRDVNIIAAVIKLYFRELMEPIFTYESYEALMTSTSTSRRGGGALWPWTQR